MKLLLAIALVATLAGCGSSKVDGTSEATMQASIVKVTKGMTPEEKDQFQKDCMAVASGGTLAGLMGGPSMMAAKLDGMTVEDIRKRAAEIRASTKDEISEARAEARKRTAENYKKILANLDDIERQGGKLDAESLKIRQETQADLEKLQAKP